MSNIKLKRSVCKTVNKSLPGEPAIGSKTDFQCESCRTNPTWGMGRNKWWLTCDCWQTDIGSIADVLTAWKKDQLKRIKAASSSHIYNLTLVES